MDGRKKQKETTLVPKKAREVKHCTLNKAAELFATLAASPLRRTCGQMVILHHQFSSRWELSKLSTGNSLPEIGLPSAQSCLYLIRYPFSMSRWKPADRELYSADFRNKSQAFSADASQYKANNRQVHFLLLVEYLSRNCNS
ncbi:hypothetical protein RRG08_010880 [Elysia crispata]|uniref:Uncharacterized protein n=1 Tax=Elysia crispata TaxID=231223 RepID=A0AAE1D9I0_9GAST|nr:hypothetical protein RRG08_010880 [Elysia crispata]